MIAKATDSGDLLSRSPVQAGWRDGAGYDGGASRERWKTLNRVSNIFLRQPVKRIYRLKKS
jgi:hypothetical protein